MRLKAPTLRLIPGLKKTFSSNGLLSSAMTLCGERYDKHREEEEHILMYSESVPHSFVDVDMN